MSRPLLVSRLLASCSLALVVLTGCTSEKKVTVSGKLVLPAGVTLVENDSVQIIFARDDDPTKSGGAATVNPADLSFTSTMSPGKYKIGVTFQPYPGMKESEVRAKQLSQRVGMYSVEATALRYEVTTDAKQTITINLAQGTVSKN